MEWNSNTLDELSSLKAARRDLGERLRVGDMRASIVRVLAQREALIAGIFIGILFGLLARLTQVVLIEV
jgi:hypothetical protein